MKKTFKLFLRISEWVIFAVILIIFFIIASPILPTKNFFVSYIVTSGSMEPAIKTGSVAITRPTQNFKEKDIIAFTNPSDPKQTVLHRIISIDKDKIKTKGDANNGADIWTIPASSIKGVLTFSIPFIGYPAAFLKTPKGFFILVIIPAILLIILQFKKIKEGINEEIIKRVGAIHESPEKIILIAIFIGAVLTFSKTDFINALFTSSVNVKGISISVASFTPTPSLTPSPSPTQTPAPTNSPPSSTPAPTIAPTNTPSPTSEAVNCNHYCQQTYSLPGECKIESDCKGQNAGYIYNCTNPNEKICCCESHGN